MRDGTGSDWTSEHRDEWRRFFRHWGMYVLIGLGGAFGVAGPPVTQADLNEVEQNQAAYQHKMNVELKALQIQLARISAEIKGSRRDIDRIHKKLDQ